MIPKSQILSISLIFLSLLTLFATYYHLMYLQNGEITFASYIADVLRATNPAPETVEVSAESGSSFLTERSAIQFWFAVAATLPLIGMAVCIYHRAKTGVSKLFLPICFVSATVTVCVLMVAHDVRALPGTL